MANNVPPVHATPLPPDLVLACSQLNLVLNNLIKYCIGQQWPKTANIPPM
jgi:hypothetical protein